MSVSEPKTIFFFFNKKDVEIATEKFGKEKLSYSVCLTKSADYEKYFPKRYAFDLNNIAKNWADSWYQGKLEIFGSLSLSLRNYFAKKLFQITSIDNLFRVENPDEVFLGKKKVSFKNLFTSDFEDISEIVKLVCAKHKVKLICEWTGDFWPLKYLIQFLLPPRLRKVIEGEDFDYKVLLAAHHYHAINIFPLLSFLQKSLLKPLLVGRIGTAKRILDKNKINYIEFNGEVPFKNLPNYLSMRLKFLLDLIRFLKSKKTFSYRGYNLWPIVKPKLISLFLSDALNLYTHKVFMKELIRYIEPKHLVCVTNDSTNQVLISTAKTLGISTLEIQHGITIGADGVYLKADKFAVWGKIPKDIYSKSGVPINKMVVTGWPGYESYLNRKFAKSEINPKNVSVTFLAQDPEGMSLLFINKTLEENLDIFFRAVSELKDKISVVIRLHPRANKSVPKIIAKKYNIDFDFSDNDSEPLSDLLKKTDIVVGQTTSATLDAILMRKPVIYLPSMRWPAKFVEGSGAVFEVKTSEEIINKINLIMKNGITGEMIAAQKKFAQDYCNFPENSVDNLVELIERISNNEKS